MLLNVNGLKKMFGDVVLFENVSFHIAEYDRIGLIGANGAGKSTLFKMLIGSIRHDGGDIFKNKHTKIGYLEQYACADSQRTIYDELLTVFSAVIAMEQELEDIRYELENHPANMDALIQRQHSLNEQFAAADGFYYRSKVRAALLGLGFSEEEFGLCVENLSGGQKTRLELGKILLSDSNLLLLDEPTNHLDMGSVEWLEDFLVSYRGAAVVISHDRYFLDRVCNRTFSLEAGRFYSAEGNYSFFVEQREVEKLTQQRNYENTQKEIQRLEGVVEQQRRWNREKNIKTAESKLKVIERLEKSLEKPAEEHAELQFRFGALPGGGNDALIVENMAMGFGEKQLFKNADVQIRKGERVFLLGPNGCGKTTFLKIILGQYTPVTGTYKIGANTKIGYYDQTQENLDMNKTVIDEVWDAYPKMTQTEIRNALAAFLFRGEDVYKVIKTLSGGERARVELVKLILQSVNFLVLDEPTNHLDIQSREALEKALEDYDGTMLVVSHDRYFVNKLATRILRMDGDKLLNFAGNYDYYLEKFKAAEVSAKTQEKKTDSAMDYQAQKKLESDRRKAMTRFQKTEAEIAGVEEEINRLNNELMEPAAAADYILAAELSEKLEELNKQLEALFIQWEELQNRIEELGCAQ